MDPKVAMRGNAVDGHSFFGEESFDIRSFAEAFGGLQHVGGRLRAFGAGGFGVVEKLFEGLRAVLGSFNARMINCLCHNNQVT